MAERDSSPVTANDLQEIARRLMIYADQFARLADQMRVHGIPSIEVKSLRTLQLGLANVRIGAIRCNEGFMDAAEKWPVEPELTRKKSLDEEAAEIAAEGQKEIEAAVLRHQARKPKPGANRPKPKSKR